MTAVLLALTGALAPAQPAPDLPRLGRPVVGLPGHVAAADGKLTLVADFANPQPGPRGGVPVYVVNRTADPVPLAMQDGDVYLKLESEAAPGTWVRAQPHEYSWCGNSYNRVDLNPGRFLVVNGYAPADGDAARVRYAFYGQGVAAASNAGRGLVRKTDVTAAANDLMRVRTGDFALVRGVALGTIVLQSENRHPLVFRDAAVWQLIGGRHDRAESERVLETVAAELGRKADPNEFERSIATDARNYLFAVREERKRNPIPPPRPKVP